MSITIPRRKLGGLEVSAIGLGCMGMSDFYGPSDEATNLNVLNAALDIGINFLDTADMYGVGANERLLGKVLKARRNQVVLATKFGIVRAPDGASLGISGTPAYVRAACDASLERLGVDHIDLYYQHRVDPKVAIEETVGAMADLVKAGKVRAVGLSEVSAATLRRAHAVYPLASVQTEYSLWTRDPEDGVLEACRALGVGFLAYSPLGRGFLTGQIKRFEDLAPDDFRRMSPRFQGDNFQKNLGLVAKVEDIAREKGVRASQLALAWVLAQGEFIVPIPGTKRRSFLEENVQASAITLSPSELRRLDEVMPRGAAVGLRYPEASMTTIDR